MEEQHENVDIDDIEQQKVDAEEEQVPDKEVIGGMEVPEGVTEEDVQTKRKPKKKCSQCNYKTELPHTMERHTAKHYKNRTVYQCSECTKVFKSLYYLCNHIKFKHVSDENEALMCTYCGKRFISTSGLYTHRSVTHEGQYSSGGHFHT